MPSLIYLIVSFIVSIASARAEPIELDCKTEGMLHSLYGTLAVYVDEAQRYIRIEAPHLPSARVEYMDGTTASVFKGKLYPFMSDEVVRQFVTINPSSIEVGWRDEDGELVHLGWFNRAALRKNGPPCRWHSAWQFALT